MPAFRSMQTTLRGEVAGARNFTRIAGVVYLVLAVVGLMSPNGFGFVPLGGNDIWLHAVLGVAMLAAGFMAKDVSTTATA